MENNVDVITAALHILEESWWGAAAHQDGYGEMSGFKKIGGEQESRYKIILGFKGGRKRQQLDGQERYSFPFLASPCIRPSLFFSLSIRWSACCAFCNRERATRLRFCVCARLFMRARVYLCRESGGVGGGFGYIVKVCLSEQSCCVGKSNGIWNTQRLVFIQASVSFYRSDQLRCKFSIYSSVTTSWWKGRWAVC